MIAVFGGSFNPIHLGHISLIKYLLKEVGSIDHIILIPSYAPPHKNSKDMPAFYHRFAMLKRAIKECLPQYYQTKIQISILERKLPTPNFTYNTLEHLSNKYNLQDIAFVIGLDMFAYLKKWEYYHELITKYKCIIFKREVSEKEYEEVNQIKSIFSPENPPIFLENKIWNYSSTKLRFMVKNNVKINNQTSKKVKEYINLKRLYN